jgi:hypothetical protein
MPPPVSVTKEVGGPARRRDRAVAPTLYWRASLAAEVAMSLAASRPAPGAVLTWTAQRRTTANVVAFLEQVETWIDPQSGGAPPSSTP